jgi:D-alanyl-D-alanine carboxypeptidase/D-alanyl-D-alanine-endopeptidase (penicillin-binding protein 4)
VDVEGYDAVLRRASGQPMPPASTQKSYVGLAALVALGPDARLRTEVARTATPVAGVLNGHLWLVAGGDPYLTRSGLRQLAREVKAAGITRVTGDLRLDDLRYDQRRKPAGWKSSFMPAESGPLSAMAVDRNRWRTDSTFLADPAFPAAVLFRDYLRAEGVRVGTVRRERRPADAVPVAQRFSSPVPAVVRRALKDSDNFASELLLKEVGRVVRGDGSSAGGLSAVRDVLGDHAVPVGAGSDGSGLSSHDRQTADGQVLLLKAAEASGSGEDFRAALPIGCRDGTLKRRYCGTPAEGRVFAKTGTLSGVRVLSGYTETESGRAVWFSFQLSGVRDGARALAAIDRAVVALAGSTD